ncbi:hypothetical protein [Apilactobacillus timberlakei]|uniref:Uncharacterized protein n=1 Tax=Apilactobacillus timberlakei TaxID=2008380 RepID=A0ABY2YRA6_9LACO|nr:hypothetical protein [Apilactobacillus timberlakei]TPR12425.1 hypothetical protein DY048_07695 [Apilactobacillus timberlakei]TPR12965.1 hypothetical protein DY052_08615 [Apilactobacillus timberlakei]
MIIIAEIEQQTKALRTMQRELDNFDCLVIDRQTAPENTSMGLLHIEDAIDRFKHLTDKNIIIKKYNEVKSNNIPSMLILIVYKSSVVFLANTISHLSNVIENTIKYGMERYGL